MKDTTCTGLPNHGVAAVGYTADYILVKNSWGDQWGEQVSSGSLETTKTVGYSSTAPILNLQEQEQLMSALLILLLATQTPQTMNPALMTRTLETPTVWT